MIIPYKKDNIFIRDLPFKASFSEKDMKVSFSGIVVKCYSHTRHSSENFENGSSSIVVEGIFDFQYGDWFYIDLEDNQIKKASKSERDTSLNSIEIPILIWKAPDKKGGRGEQILSENVFLQDYEAERVKGFTFQKTKAGQGSNTFSFSSGVLIAPSKNFAKFFNKFDIALESGREPKYRIKINASAVLSDEDPSFDSNRRYIKDYSIINAEIESYEEDEEDDLIKLTPVEDDLSGVYYINLPLNGGVVEVFFESFSEESVRIDPFLETQVRGSKFNKNGISTAAFSGATFNDEPGFYKKIIETVVYDLFSVEDGGEGVGSIVTYVGDYTIEKTYTVEGELFIVEGEPVILTEISQPELGDNEFIEGPISREITIEGSEISASAYSACKRDALSQDWTPLEQWGGDITPVLRGGGGEGYDDKLKSIVVYAERRFKKVGLFNNTPQLRDFLPESFYHHSWILYENDTERDTSGLINLNKELLIYKDESWTEITTSEDNIYGKEVIKSEGELSGGQYLYKDITKLAYDSYNRLIMTTGNSTII